LTMLHKFYASHNARTGRLCIHDWRGARVAMHWYPVIKSLSMTLSSCQRRTWWRLPQSSRFKLVCSTHYM